MIQANSKLDANYFFFTADILKCQSRKSTEKKKIIIISLQQFEGPARTCAFPTMTSKNVCGEKDLLVTENSNYVK